MPGSWLHLAISNASYNIDNRSVDGCTAMSLFIIAFYLGTSCTANFELNHLKKQKRKEDMSHGSARLALRVLP